MATTQDSNDIASADQQEPLLEREGGDNERTLYHEEYRPPFLPALVLVPFLLPFFWKYSVTCSRTIDSTHDTIVFGYTSSSTRVELQQSLIEHAEPIEYTNGLKEWLGWGIRINLNGEVGYIAKNGPAVRLWTRSKDGTTDEETTTYVFNCNDPKSVCDILMNQSRQSQ